LKESYLLMLTRWPARSARVLVPALAALALMVGLACAEEDEPTPTSSTESTATVAPPKATATATPGTVAVIAVDYAYQGLPASVPAGTTFTLTNRATAELHEFVAIRIPDSERRPVSELLRLPDAEIEAIFGDAPPATVILAPPGQSGMAVVGDGKIAEAGRYAIVCFIPTGADPQAYLEAAQASTEGPPQVDGGPPHAAQGMFAELTVR
jgi:hypothetical protein